MTEVSEGAKRIRLQAIAENWSHVPLEIREAILQSMRDSDRTMMEQLVPDAQLTPVVESVQQNSFSADQVRSHCRDFLTSVNWPSVENVDLDRIELNTHNAHARQVRTSNMRQTPEKPGEAVMLLYKLLDDDIDKQFSKGDTLYGDVWRGKLLAHDIILLGPSGCGKTRKLFELLVRKKGYYLIPRSDSLNDRNYGSCALRDALSLANLKKKTSFNLWSELNAEVDRYDRRRQVVEFSVKCVLLSYAMIYTEWSEWLRKAKANEVSAQAWLLVQLFPTFFFRRDWFTRLAEELVRLLPVSFHFPPILFPDDFVCALDEAQVLGDHLVNRFQSTDAEHPDSLRPALSPVLRAIHDALSIRLILSGTGLSMLKETIWNSVVSNMATTNATGDQFIFCDFQPLTSDEVHDRLKELVNHSGSTDLEYVAQWLAGRPRFLATFLENVITNSYDVEGYIKRYVRDLTNSDLPRTPASLLARLANEPAELKLGGERARNLYDRFMLMSYWISHGLGKLTDANPSLVELGLGYASTITGGVPPYIESSLSGEPLILEAARCRRSPSDLVAIYNLLNGINATDVGKRLVYVVAGCLNSLLFEKPLQDCDLFQGFQLPEVLNDTWVSPEWQFGQIAVTEPDDTKTTRRDFYEWMNGVLDPAKEKIRMRFPSNSAGPDIVCVVRNQAKTRVLPVFVQVKFDRRASANEAFHTVDPSLLHHQNRGSTPTIVEGVKEEHARLMKQLDSPVVRIVVSSKKPDCKMPKLRLVPFKRGDKMGQDICVFLDENESEKVFGVHIAKLLDQLSSK